MLEDPRLILTVNLPMFLEDKSFTTIEIFYCKWINLWLEYGDKDWVGRALETHWEECDDCKDSVSRHQYAEQLLREYSVELEEHFNVLTTDITYQKLPTQITVKPTGMKGVVLWSIT